LRRQLIDQCGTCGDPIGQRRRAAQIDGIHFRLQPIGQQPAQPVRARDAIGAGRSAGKDHATEAAPRQAIFVVHR
jgi:hypothetical protein